MRKLSLLLLCLAWTGCGQPNANPASDPGKTSNTNPGVAANTDLSVGAADDALESQVAAEDDDEPVVSSDAKPEAKKTAANANVTKVRAIAQQGSWTFHVTIDHPDTGWKDYADGWDVVLPDRTVVKPEADTPFTRLLLHPHENERPFTRSQSNIVIPNDVTSVTVRAHDLVDGFGGHEVTVDLNSAEGPGFTVER